ncbi:MAG: cadherin repeat domain-containing protein [Verrucomicrobiales bacterium]|nr:cadherin repeat domain-containing protein [Verrucomicrobiales bacterium]
MKLFANSNWLSGLSTATGDTTVFQFLCSRAFWRARCRGVLLALLVICAFPGDTLAVPRLNLTYKGQIQGLLAKATIGFEDLRIGVSPAGFVLAGGRPAWVRREALNGRIYLGAEVLTPTAAYVLNGDVASTSDWGYADATRTDAFERFLVRLDFPSDENFVYLDGFSLTPNPLDGGSSVYHFELDVPGAAPVMAAIPNQTVNEGTTLSFTVSATDADVPAQTLTFTLERGSPPGTSIDPRTGVFTWTPTLGQGQNKYVITVRVSDSGSPALSDTKTFSVVVHEANASPVLAEIGNRTIHPDETLAFSAVATDPDQPAQVLTFSLDPGAPAGASINPETGAFNWTPTEAEAGGTYTATIRVTDGGSPKLSSTKTFTIVVAGSVGDLRLIGVVVSTEGAATIRWRATAGSAYRLLYKNSLDDATWSLVGETVGTDGSGVLEDRTAIRVSQRFYRLERTN